MNYHACNWCFVIDDNFISAPTNTTNCLKPENGYDIVQVAIPYSFILLFFTFKLYYISNCKASFCLLKGFDISVSKD